MILTDDQRFELLKIEIQLLQGVFNKYDGMIFSSRNWFVTLWMATLGLGFTADLPILILMAAALAILYWILEGVMRHQYWYKYVIRYRAVRENLNKTPPSMETLSLFDLTHSYAASKPSEWDRIRGSFGKLEPIVLYSALALGALLMWSLVVTGAIQLRS